MPIREGEKAELDKIADGWGFTYQYIQMRRDLHTYSRFAPGWEVSPDFLERRLGTVSERALTLPESRSLPGEALRYSLREMDRNQSAFVPRQLTLQAKSAFFKHKLLTLQIEQPL